MSENFESNKMHYMVALLLGVMGLLVILIFVSIRSQAGDASKPASVSINNATPSVSNVTVALGTGGDQSNITLSDDSDVTAFVHGAYSDNNGCHEVENGTLEVAFYGPTKTQADCDSTDEADLDDCYYASYTVAGGVVSNATTGNGPDSCTLDLGTGCTEAGDTTLTANYECEFTGELAHFMDPGTWNAAVRVTDSNEAASGWNTETSFTVNELAAISVDTASINYGSLSLGGVTTSRPMVISNTGNEEALDVNVAATLMDCTIGDFGSGLDIAAQKYGLTDSAFGDLTYSASSTQQRMTDLNLNRQTTAANAAEGSNPNNTIYFGLTVPSDSVAGTCSSTLSFYANGTAE